MFLQLGKSIQSNASLVSQNDELKRKIDRAQIEYQEMQTRLKAVDEEKLKLAALVQKLRKGISDQNNQNNISEETEKYEVKALIDHKKQGRKRFFLIRWANYDSSHDEWVAEKNLSCPDLLNEYLKSKNLQ